ncbi:MAG: hypothetical protein WCR42_10110 [bacterium]
MYRNIFLLLALISTIIVLQSCGDAVPTDYVEETYVEAYLFVNEPVRAIKIMRTLPVQDSFDINKSIIREAEVALIEGAQRIDLHYVENSITANAGYAAVDPNYIVKPQTLYKIEIKLKNGNVITGQTLTPPTSKPIKVPPRYVNFPDDTVNYPADPSLESSWEAVPGLSYYATYLKCLDTIGYGKYLPKPTDEKNRALSFPWMQNKQQRAETTSWAFVLSNKAPLVWNMFKWYGLHEAVVFVPDYNFLRWYFQVTMQRTIDPILSSVVGDHAIGVFGSAFAIRDTFVLVKNKPLK